jgi:hypothetical protein
VEKLITRNNTKCHPKWHYSGTYDADYLRQNVQLELRGNVVDNPADKNLEVAEEMLFESVRKGEHRIRKWMFGGADPSGRAV